MKAILFDLDGTLLDSMHVWDTIGEAFLIDQRIEIPTNLQAIIAPMSFAQSAAYFITLGNLDMSVEEVCRQFYQMVQERYKKDITCKPYVKAFLKECKRQNIRMGILTALDEFVAQTCLKHNDIDSYFSFILTCDAFGKGKDEVDIYYEGAKRLQVEPSDVYVFEDSLYCMKSAKLAGMKVIGVYDATQSISQVDKDKYCDKYIYSFKDIIEEDM